MTDNRSGSRSVEVPPEAGRLGGHATDNQEYWYDLIEKDDRNSPGEYPDMALITRDELFTYLDQARAEPVRHASHVVDSSVSRFATGRLGSDDFLSQSSVSTFSAHITSIPHTSHRYPTVGDWQFRASNHVTIDVKVSATSDWRHAALIAVHELIEAIICRHRGISQDEVDSFDLSHPELADPGESENAPYHDEHMSAEFIERQLAGLLNVDWTDYNAALDALDE